jgi:GH15 family glucan-1,4-alpha-glucosidase
MEDYAPIGDCHTVAMVGRDGSVDWLCLPRFDSGACFAALLGNAEHGRWRLAPAGGIRRSARRYRPDTLVLETDFETDQGAVTLVDCMPPRTRQPEVVRLVVGRRGRVSMRMELLCTFWLADNLALLGRREDALRLFERLLEIRNDVGRLAEQYDPATHRFMGDFPQAFSHVALLDTAHNLTQTGGPAAHRCQG